jgi:hypothetical protein
MREWLNLLGPSAKVNDPPKWFERDAGDTRLSHDRKLLGEKYPDLQFALDFRLLKAVLRGSITLTEERSGIPNTIKTRIIFPDNYPDTEPFAFDDGDHFPHIGDRHFYTTGLCCLWLPLESQWRKGEVNGLLNFVDQVSIFFERQLIYDASGMWAWGERGHNEKGYIEFLEDKLGGDYSSIKVFLPLLLEQTFVGRKCPCGSRRYYESCHKHKVEEIKEAIKYFNDKGIYRLTNNSI